MNTLKQYQETKAMDWRAQLKRNERRTRTVIFLFFLIYLCVGFLVDLVIYSNTYQATLWQIAKAILLFQVMPYATITMTVAAVISLWVTYTFYDKIILLGTEYKQILPEGENTVEETQLYNVIEEMKVAAGLKFMPKVFVIEANYMNAFASGYSEKSAMVAITRGLMEKLNRSELQAVMAHELSHIRHHDIKLTLMTSVLSNIILIVVDLLFYNLLFNNRRRENDPRLVFIILFLRYVLPMLTVLLMLYLSRTREYMADAGCVELMRDNEPLAQALLKIHEDHQQNQEAYANEYSRTAHEDIRRASYLYDPINMGINPIKSAASLFSTHPDMEDRLRALGFKKK